MKSLEEYLSEVISPFDENDEDQQEVLRKAYLRYQRDSIIDTIGTLSCKHYIHIFLDDILNELSKDECDAYIQECFDKLCEHYNMPQLKDYSDRNMSLQRDPESVISLLRFLELDSWLYDMISILPPIEIKDLEKSQKIRDFFVQNHAECVDKIEKCDQVPQLFKTYVLLASLEDFADTMTILVMKDVVGVVSVQLSRIG